MLLYVVQFTVFHCFHAPARLRVMVAVVMAVDKLPGLSSSHVAATRWRLRDDHHHHSYAVATRLDQQCIVKTRERRSGAIHCAATAAGRRAAPHASPHQQSRCDAPKGPDSFSHPADVIQFPQPRPHYPPLLPSYRALYPPPLPAQTSRAALPEPHHHHHLAAEIVLPP